MLKKGLVLLGFLLLILLFTFPFTGHLLNQVYADGDEFFTRIWRYWWYKETLVAWWQAPGRTLGEFIRYGILTQEQYMNTGNTLDLLVFTYPLNCLFTFPLYWNLNLLLILLLNALGGYALGHYLTRNRIIAFLIGLFMAFNPYVYQTLAAGRFKDGLLCFNCLFILFFLKTLQEKEWRNPMLAGLFLGISSLLYWFYGINLSIFLIFALLWVVFWKKKELPSKFPGRILLLLLVGFVIAYPFAFEYQQGLRRGDLNHTELTYGHNFPTINAIFSGDCNQDLIIHGARAIMEDSLPLNAPAWPLVLIPFFLLAFFSREKLKNWLFILSGLLFWLICLGPFIKIKTLFLANPVYQFLYKYYPMVSRQTHTSKFFSLCWVFFVLAAFMGVEKLLKLLPPKKIFALLLALLMTAGYLAELRHRHLFPWVTGEVKIPAFYRQLKTGDAPAIIEVPTVTGRDLYNYYQAFHGKKIYPSSLSNCYSKDSPNCPERISWLGEDLYSKYAQNSFILYLNSLTSPAPLGGYRAADLETLKKDGFKFLVLHEGTVLLLNQGEELFDHMALALQAKIGPPCMKETEIWVTDINKTKYRVLIYRL